MRKELMEQRNAAVEKMESLVNKAKAENRALTNEEQTDFANCEAEIAVSMKLRRRRSAWAITPR